MESLEFAIGALLAVAVVAWVLLSLARKESTPASDRPSSPTAGHAPTPAALPRPTSGPDPLQPGDALVFVNRPARHAGGWALVTVACVLGGRLLPEPADVVVPMMGGFAGGFFTLAMWVNSRAVARELAAMQRGEYLARWSIGRDRWLAWFDTVQTGWDGLSVGQGIGVAATGLVTAVLAFGDIGPDGVAFLARCALGFGVAVALANLAHRPTRPRHMGETVPVVVGPRGAVTMAVDYSWADGVRTVLDAEVEPSPPRLVVRFRVPQKHGHTIETVSVPIPEDRLGEAAWVAEAIATGAVADDGAP